MSGASPANIPAGQRWDQGHFVHVIRGESGPNGERGPIERQVILAPSEIHAKQWAQAARDAGFEVKTSPWGTDGLWCYEKE